VSGPSLARDDHVFKSEAVWDPTRISAL